MSTIQNGVRGLALCTLALLGLSACTTTGYSGFSSEPTGQIGIAQHPDINGGRIDPAAYQKISQLAESCQQQLRPQMAGAGQSAATGALSYGLAGAAGVAGGAAAGFGGGIDPAEYAAYGGIAGVANGVVAGMTQGSVSQATAIAACSKEFWDISKRTEEFVDIGRGTIIVPVMQKAWGNPAPPALDTRPVAPQPPAPPPPSRR